MGFYFILLLFSFGRKVFLSYDLVLLTGLVIVLLLRLFFILSMVPAVKEELRVRLVLAFVRSKFLALLFTLGQ
jgi:hypothetical protein